MIKLLNEVIKKNWLTFLALMICFVLSLLLTLLPAQMTKYILDNVLTAPTVNQKTLILVALAYFGIIFLTCFSEVAKQSLLVIFGERVTKKIRKTLLEKVNQLPLSYFYNHNEGELTSLFINDVDCCHEAFTSGAINLIFDCFKIIGIVSMMFAFKLSLGIFTLCFLPIVFVLTLFFRKRTYQSQKRNRILLGEVTEQITEEMENSSYIKQVGKEQYMKTKFTEILNQNYQAVQKSNFFDSLYSPLIKTLAAGVTVLLFILNRSFPLTFGISLGILGASFDYLTSLFQPIDEMGMELQNLQKIKAGVIRIEAFLQEEVEQEKTVQVKNMLQSASDITFTDVSFAYSTSEVLHHLSFHLEEGKTLLIMGRTGSGKSTLMHLIKGDYQASSGSVKIGNITPSTIKDEDKSLLFGYVSQSFEKVESTIFDNLTVKNTTVTKEQVENALDLVGLKTKIDNLPAGLLTPFVSAKFSEGELQLLGIARAMVKNPKILIFDEITSHLDTKTEHQLFETIEKVTKDKTTIFITHRFSYLKKDFLLAHLEQGKFVFFGNAIDAIHKDTWIKDCYWQEKNGWK